MIKIALASLVSGTLVFASSTMCFKKDHVDPSNIEVTALDGGECGGKLSVTDMKKRGYNVKDIKVTMGQNGMDYMYIFSKETVAIGNSPAAAQNGGQVLTKAQLRMYLEDLKEEERVEKEAKQRIANAAAGKTRYEQLCKECHGDKGEKSAYGVAKPLNSMSLDDMQYAIRDYTISERTGGLAVLMKPYADMLTEDEVENIYSYLQTIK